MSDRKEHWCGLSGYNPMLGDTCPACEENRNVEAPAPAQPSTSDCVKCGCKHCGGAIHLNNETWVHSAAGLIKYGHNAEPAQPTTVVHVPVPEGNESRYVEVLREQSQASQPVAEPSGETSSGADEIAQRAATNCESFVHGNSDGYWLNKEAAAIVIGVAIRDYTTSLEARLTEEKLEHESTRSVLNTIISGWQARAEAAEARNKELEQWKREMMEVSRLWDGVTKYLQDHFEVMDWGKTWQAAIIRRLDDRYSLSLLLREVQETLKAHEWSGLTPHCNAKGDFFNTCPGCEWRESIWHADDCWLSALLTRLTGGQP